MLFKNVLFALFSSAVFTFLSLHADELSFDDEEFLKSIEEVSEIATRTKLNIDDMPAIVTILRNEKLKYLGIETVYEALSLVPGVELSMEPSGAKQIIFRGVKEKGKVLLIVDGVSINNTYRDSIYYYLDFPIELVERIEVIRGPGSVLYGSSAISGVVSIITKNQTDSRNSVFGLAASDDTYKGGAQLSHHFENGMRLSLDGYYQTSNQKVNGGPDKSGRMGQSDESLKDYSIGVTLQGEKLSIVSRLKNSHAGPAFGSARYFESSNDRDGIKNESAFAEVTYRDELTDKLFYTAVAGMRNYKQYADLRMIPNEENGDLIYQLKVNENSYFTDVSLLAKYFEPHDIVIGFSGEYDNEISNYFNNYFENTHQPYIQGNDVIKQGISRTVFSLYANDQFRVSQSVDVSAGLRWSHYSDFGNNLSPSVGVVWRALEKVSFKAMYARAFRAPSWIELYASLPNFSMGNSSLKPEISDTSEVGVVYRYTTIDSLRFDMYASQIDNLIIRDSSGQYANRGINRYYGAEVEWFHSFSPNADLSLNGSYVYGLDNDGKKLSDIANYLANATFIYKFGYGVTSGTLFQYVSPRKRNDSDPRGALNGYGLFDETLTYAYEFLEVSAIVKNIFDAKVSYPTIYDPRQQTYQSDLDRPGRTFWIKATLVF